MIGVELRTSNQEERATALVHVVDDISVCYLDKDRIGTRWYIFYGSTEQCNWVSNGKGACPVILEREHVLARYEELMTRFEAFCTKKSPIRVVRAETVHEEPPIWKLAALEQSLDFVKKQLQSSKAEKILIAYSILLDCEEVMDAFERAVLRREEQEQKVSIHTPDYDLEAYLANNNEVYALDDIVNVHALVPGHNDEDSWYWIIEVKDSEKPFVLTSAWCDYTGWDCQSGGWSEWATSAEEAALLAPEREERSGRFIRRNLLAQLRKEQPFGVEVIPAP